ncbi:STAS domain-containing protein [Nocardioides guangzhouensis]|nr:STAS domain-containing protein [Nocardioides guangzhouensis]
MDGSFRTDLAAAHVDARIGAGVEVEVPHHLDPGAVPRSRSHQDVDVAVVLLGDGDLGRALGDLRRRLATVLERGPATLVMDLSGVTQLSSTGIAVLLWVKRRCAAREVGVVLREPSRRSVDLLRRTGLLGALAIEGLDATASRGGGAGTRGRP